MFVVQTFWISYHSVVLTITGLIWEYESPQWIQTVIKTKPVNSLILLYLKWSYAREKLPGLLAGHGLNYHYHAPLPKQIFWRGPLSFRLPQSRTNIIHTLERRCKPAQQFAKLYSALYCEMFHATDSVGNCTDGTEETNRQMLVSYE